MRKNAKKWVTVVCHQCQKSFEKPFKEYNRKRPNIPHCCSRKCSNQLTKVPTDEFSPFRIFHKNLKGSCKVKELPNDFDVVFLKELWESQKGICPYTNQAMILPKTSSPKSRVHSLLAASLDRIDSSKGYIKGNVEFVCRFVNLGKNGYSKQEVLELLNKIKFGQ